MSLLSAETVAAALRRKAEAEAAGISSPLEAVFLTVAREPQYIHVTLRSFLEADPAAALLLPVKLVVGGADAAYLRPYEEQGLARIMPMTPPEVERMEGFPVPEGRRTHYRLNTNYLRALTVPRDPAKGLLLFEDDIRFTGDWLRKLTTVLQWIEAARQKEFLLTLYSAFPYESTTEFDTIRPDDFYGSQGLYYPPTVVKRMAVFLRHLAVERYGPSADVGVGLFCREEAIPLLRTRHSLVQHEGMVTTGLSPAGGSQHRSPTFVE